MGLSARESGGGRISICIRRRKVLGRRWKQETNWLMEVKIRPEEGVEVDV